MMVVLCLFGFLTWLKNGNYYILILKIFNIKFILAKFCEMFVGF